MKSEYLDRNLALEAVRVTEMAALASSLHMGRGNEKQADQSAVNAMRKFLNSLMISGKVVIGEGERDKAPMLYIGEKVGLGGPKVDIAIDPLEGTTITAHGGENALSVLAMGEEGSFLHSPDIYMYKIAYGKNYENLNFQENILTNLNKSKIILIYLSFIKLTNSSVVKAGLYSQIMPNLSLQDPKTLNKIDALEALQMITPVPS